MKRGLLAAVVLSVLLGVLTVPALAQDAAPAAPATWGGHAASVDATSTSRRDAPVTRARALLARARSLDDAAASDEKAAATLALKLPTLRIEANAARERAERASPEQRELLRRRAEDLEADVIISEAEIAFWRKTAIENRQLAHELRLRSVILARQDNGKDPRTEESTESPCDPPFHYSSAGRKVYRLECLN